MAGGNGQQPLAHAGVFSGEQEIAMTNPGFARFAFVAVGE